jgi:dienelactone hydrolase
METLVETLDDGSYVCRPAGAGPFPAVLYNHGGLAMAVGGDLLATCTALADAGYLAWSEQRPLSDNPTIAGHLDEVLDALTALRARADVDTDRIGIMGYSRGGLLTLHTAIERPSEVQAVILMAPAPGGGPTNLDDALANVDPITAPVLLLVAENDGPPAQEADHVEICRLIQTTLEEASKSVELTVYPAFGEDGHELFFEVREPYWSDVLSFFTAHL